MAGGVQNYFPYLLEEVIKHCCGSTESTFYLLEEVVEHDWRRGGGAQNPFLASLRMS